MFSVKNADFMPLNPLFKGFNLCGQHPGNFFSLQSGVGQLPFAFPALVLFNGVVSPWECDGITGKIFVYAVELHRLCSFYTFQIEY